MLNVRQIAPPGGHLKHYSLVYYIESKNHSFILDVHKETILLAQIHWFYFFRKVFEVQQYFSHCNKNKEISYKMIIFCKLPSPINMLHLKIQDKKLQQNHVFKFIYRVAKSNLDKLISHTHM